MFEDSKAQHQSQQGGILHERPTEKPDVYESQSSSGISELDDDNKPLSQLASVGRRRRRCEG